MNIENDVEVKRKSYPTSDRMRLISASIKIPAHLVKDHQEMNQIISETLQKTYTICRTHAPKQFGCQKPSAT